MCSLLSVIPQYSNVLHRVSLSVLNATQPLGDEGLIDFLSEAFFFLILN